MWNIFISQCKYFATLNLIYIVLAEPHLEARPREAAHHDEKHGHDFQFVRVLVKAAALL